MEVEQLGPQTNFTNQPNRKFQTSPQRELWGFIEDPQKHKKAPAEAGALAKTRKLQSRFNSLGQFLRRRLHLGIELLDHLAILTN